MHDALNATGHSIFFSICEWGFRDPATWAPTMGNSWRTTGDINPSWKSWTRILDANDQWWQQAGPGGWNDPDMLEVDNGDMTVEEQRAHFTLWCLIKAPLLLGMDLRTISESALEIITNKEVIQWNQDKMGVQGHRVFQQHLNASTPPQPQPQQQQQQRNRSLRSEASLMQQEESNSDDEPERIDEVIEVWAGPLENGHYAVVLFNRGTQSHAITADWRDIGIATGQVMKGRDVWAHQDIGTFVSNFSATVRPHDVMAIQLEPVALGQESVKAPENAITI